MLGVREEYQRQGIGATLIKWGTDQGELPSKPCSHGEVRVDVSLADRDNLETYLDASTKGQPYYKKQHGFGGLEKDVVVPDRWVKRRDEIIDTSTILEGYHADVKQACIWLVQL